MANWSGIPCKLGAKGTTAREATWVSVSRGQRQVTPEEEQLLDNFLVSVTAAKSPVPGH